MFGRTRQSKTLRSTGVLSTHGHPHGKRKVSKINLDRVREEALARAKAEGREIDVEARLRKVVMEGDLIDPTTRTLTAIAMLQEDLGNGGTGE